MGRSPESTSTPHAPVDRKRRAVLVVAAVLVFGYPLAANLFLAFGGVQTFFAGTESVHVDFKSAWSFWPGQVHVNDIRVTMQDHNVQFVLEIPHTDVTVRLRDLAHRTFHATRVRGDGVAFRIRHRILPEAKDQPWVAALPPIPGFGDPPLREHGPPAPPIDDAHYDLWTVHIENVDVGVREVWTEMFRYQGVARASGAFRLIPARRVWVGPAEFRAESGTVVSGPHQVASSVRGTIDCTVDDFDVRPPDGMAVFRFISARTDLAASVPNLDALNTLAGTELKVKIADGTGAVDMHAAIEHGVFTPESRFAYRTSEVGLVAGPVKFRLAGDFVVSATGAPHGGPTQLVLGLPNGRLTWEGARHAPIDLRGLEASMGTTSTDLAVPWSFTGARGNLAMSLPDLGSITDAHAGPPVEVRQGTGEAEAWLIVSPDQRMQGALRGHAQEVQLCDEHAGCSASPKVEISGDLAGDLQGHARGSLTAEASDVDSDFGRTHVNVRSLVARADVTSEDVRAKLDFRTIRAGPSRKCSVIGARSVTFEGRILTPDGAPSSVSGRGTVEAPSFAWGSFSGSASRATIATSWNGDRWSSQVSLAPIRMESSGGPPQGWLAEVGSTTLKTDLRVSAGGLRGPMKIEALHVASRVGNTEMRGDAALGITLDTHSGPSRTADIGGSVELRRIAFSHGNKDVADWWADIGFQHLHIDARQNVDLVGNLSARFRDALPAIYVLAEKEQLPKWTPYLMPLRRLSLDMHVERVCHWTDVQLLGASTGPLRASGRVQVKPGDTRGAILLQLAVLSRVAVGLQFGQDTSETTLFAGRGWLEQHLEPLNQAAIREHDALQARAAHLQITRVPQLARSRDPLADFGARVQRRRSARSPAVGVSASRWALWKSESMRHPRVSDFRACPGAEDPPDSERAVTQARPP